MKGGELVMYGCMSGKPPPFQWQSFVFKGLRVSGFNFRQALELGTALPRNIQLCVSPACTRQSPRHHSPPQEVAGWGQQRRLDLLLCW